MVIKRANVFQADGHFEKRDIYVNNGILVEKEDAPEWNKEKNQIDETSETAVIIDASDLYAIPGLTDIHFHGCVGYDFCNGTKEAIQAMAEYQGNNGITTICPATMTLSEEQLETICQAAKEYQSETGAILCGINMEGPFISTAKKGAQNAKYIHKPDVEMFERLQEKSGNLFKLVAIAPEEEGAMEFIKATKDKVVLSVAHTTADYDIAKEAMEQGASHVTHLYNAMPPFSHRAPGVVGAAFDSPGCEVELICDGIHIHPSMVRATFQMFGDNRVILISDSMEATGMPDGTYSLGGQKVIKVGNHANLEDGTLAGSATNLMDCVRTVVKKMGIPLETAIKSAAVNSAKSIGIYDQYGSLETGKTANIVLLNKELEIVNVWIKGKKQV